MKGIMDWKNKIVGHAEVPPDQLLAHPENWRIHPRYQQEALRGVINDIGFIKSVTVNKLTGRVVDGHLRVTLALRDSIPTIPVEYVELTEAEEAEALLTLDPIAALAGSDKQNLETLLAQVETGDAAVMELLSKMSQDAGVIPPEFKEYDETIADGIEVCKCPTCGHEHAAKKN